MDGGEENVSTEMGIGIRCSRNDYSSILHGLNFFFFWIAVKNQEGCMQLDLRLLCMSVQESNHYYWVNTERNQLCVKHQSLSTLLGRRYMFESLCVYTFICDVKIILIKIAKMCHLPNALCKSSSLTCEVCNVFSFM